MEFNESKKVGDILEVQILKRINKKYPKAFIDDKGKKFSDWDIFIPEIHEGIEVKGDYMSKITGNIVIEVEMYGKPSALSKTKAKYWAIVDGFRIIWIKPIEIYRFIELNRYQRTIFKGDGDNVKKFAYLVPRDNLVLYIYNKLDKEDGWIEILKENDILYYNNFSKNKVNND